MGLFYRKSNLLALFVILSEAKNLIRGTATFEASRVSLYQILSIAFSTMSKFIPLGLSAYLSF